jgi:hypothetical protein
LNCSNPAHAAACAQAEASNSYEGETIELSAEDIAALLQVRFKLRCVQACCACCVPFYMARTQLVLVCRARQCAEVIHICWTCCFAALQFSYSTVQPYASAADPLAGLEVDCTAQPEVCAGISASTNTYEEDSSTADDSAVAEAAAYLTAASTAVHHAAAWDAVIGSQHVQDTTEKERESVLGLTNRYEGVQASSWQYKRQAEEAGARYLDISVLDLDCSPAAVSTDAYAQQECMRSKAVNRYESSNTGALAVEPALEHAESAIASTADNSVLSAAVGVTDRSAPCLRAGRRYYKNPCNSPAGRDQYKNPQQQQPAQRKHYKNPANAPATLDVLLPQAAKVSCAVCAWDHCLLAGACSGPE